MRSNAAINRPPSHRPRQSEGGGGGAALFHLQPELLDQLAPFLFFAVDVVGIFRRRRGQRIAAFEMDAAAVRAGNEGWASSATGIEATSPIGAKSLRGSRPSLA